MFSRMGEIVGEWIKYIVCDGLNRGSIGQKDERENSGRNGES